MVKSLKHVMNLPSEGGTHVIYLDQTATTKPDIKVLQQFVDDSRRFFANPNSSHDLGKEALEAINGATDDVLGLLKANHHAITYVSGATEANNLAIKGTAAAKKHLGRHILTTPFEHPSVMACFSRLVDQGYDIDMVPLDANGHVDLKGLKDLLRRDTILVSIGMVQSETGIVQNITDIKTLLDDYPNITFHSDVTQATGKIAYDINMLDLASLSAHKFGGIRGIGALIRRKDIPLKGMIDGGHALDHLRSGTPATALILSLRYALKKAYERRDRQYEHVRRLKKSLIDRLSQCFDSFQPNFSDDAVPHIVNVSFIGYEASELLKALSDKGIYVSTQTACSSGASLSRVIMTLTGSKERARSSLRISLSHDTTMEDIESLCVTFKEMNLR